MKKKFKPRMLKPTCFNIYDDQLKWLRTFKSKDGGYNKVLRFIIDECSDFKKYLKESSNE